MDPLSADERAQVWNRSLQQHLQELFGVAPEDVILVATRCELHRRAHADGLTDFDTRLLKQLHIQAEG